MSDLRSIILPVVSPVRLLAGALAALCLVGSPALVAQTAGASPAAPADAADASAADKLRFANGLMAREFYDMAEAEFREFLRQYPDHAKTPVATFGLIQTCRAQQKMDCVLDTIRTFQRRWPNHKLAPKLHLWEGETLIQQGKLAEAEDAFKRLLNEEDSVIREAALYFIGEATMRRGLEEKALAVYRKLAEKPFDGTHQYRPYAVYAIGAQAQHQGDVQTAQEMFKRLAEGDPVPRSLQEEGLYRLAQVLFRKGRYAEAIVRYESLLVEFPEGRFSREARKRRLWAHYQLAHYEKAGQFAAQWRERYPETFDYEVLFIQAASLMTQDLHRQAGELFASLGMSAEVPAPYRRSARYQQIFCALKLDQFADVENLAAAFLADFPDAPERLDVRFFQMEAAHGLEKYEQVTAPLGKLLEEAPAQWEYRADAVNVLADAFDKLDKTKQQANVLRAAAQQGGEWAPEWLLRAAEAEREIGNRDAAIKDLEVLLRRHADSRREAIAATLYLAELYSIEDRFEHAEALVRELLKKEETKSIRGRLHYLLGYVYGQQQRYQSAEKELRTALEQGSAPELVSDAKAFLIYVLLQRGETDAALELFAEILAMPVEQRAQMDADLLFRLEEIYYLRNRYDTCRTLCEWLRTHPQTDVQFRAGLRLAELHIATKGLDAARALLETLRDEQREILADNPDARTRLAAVASLLGEVAMLTGDLDRAVTAFEETLDTEGVRAEYITRARWGLAEILHREDRLDQALRYAMNAFILGDHPTYTPKAMFKAVEILVELDRTQEARTTWEELRQRYPAFAARKQQAEVILQLGEKKD